MVAVTLKKSLLNLCQNGVAQKIIARANSGISYQQALAYAPATRLTTLDNNMRIASQDNGKATTTLGLYLELGSRDENPGNSGIGNMFEHLAFQGTANRSAADLEKEISSLGCRLNIKRGREISAITATCVNEHIPKVVEILADIAQNSKFDEAEIEKQKGIMLGKIENLEATNIEAVVEDYLHQVAFQDTPLALSPYGTTNGIKSLTQDDLVDYRKNFLVSDRMVLSAAGGVDHAQLTELAGQHFVACDGSKSYAPTREFCRFTGASISVRDDDMPAAHMMVAYNSPAIGDEDFLKFELAKCITGSWNTTQPGLNSGRPLISMLAKTDILHSFKLFNIGYKDSGLFGYYTTCGRLRCQDVQESIACELNRLCSYISAAELQAGKNQLRTNIWMSLESNDNVARDIATQIIYNGKRLSAAELDDAIENITLADITDTVAKYVLNMIHCQAGTGPIESMFHYQSYAQMSKMFSLI